MSEKLSEKNISEGLVIINSSHPEFGNWTVGKDRNGWTIRNHRGSKMLWENEFHYYKLVK